VTISARDEVLARIRSAIVTAVSPDVPRDYRAGAPADVELLVDRLVDYRAIVHRCAPAGIAGAILEAADAAGIDRLFAPPGLDPAWQPSDRHVSIDDGTLTATDLDGNDVGVITTCSVAICETGTIVLDGGPGQGRRLLTLVPDHHICVVLAEQVVGGVPDAFRRLDPRRPLTWISGPSATSDIELKRVEGVHGPRHLVVIIVDHVPGSIPAP